MNSIKVSDAMWQAAEAVVAMGKKSGVNISVSDVYNKETAKELALIGRFLLSQVETATKETVKVINDT